MAEEKTNLIKPSISAQLEALLFVAPGGVTTTQLATAIGITPRNVEKSLEELNEIYAERGIRIQRHQGEIRLTSAPEIGQIVERFLDLEATTRLSKAALEALAIIAYEQPVTRPHIDSIRGVSSDGVLRTLLSKGLAEEAGRAEGPGRPILYTTSPEFLGHFGLSSLDELPLLELPDVEYDEFSTAQPELLKD
ncbi:MAG: SMC-Scp complex subunit ScpB [Chloroflexota bacterium]